MHTPASPRPSRYLPCRSRAVNRPTKRSSVSSPTPSKNSHPPGCWTYRQAGQPPYNRSRTGSGTDRQNEVLSALHPLGARKPYAWAWQRDVTAEGTGLAGEVGGPRRRTARTVAALVGHRLTPRPGTEACWSGFRDPDPGRSWPRDLPQFVPLSTSDTSPSPANASTARSASSAQALPFESPIGYRTVLARASSRSRSSSSVRPAPCGPGSGRASSQARVSVSVCTRGRVTRPAARARVLSQAFMPYQSRSSSLPMTPADYDPLTTPTTPGCSCTRGRRDVHSVRVQTFCASEPGVVGLCEVVGATSLSCDRTDSSTFLPRSASTLLQYWNAFARIGSVTPLSR